jgi:PAS domain S-box-containing protein/diguanylate cyclase (GGDEF)-like protein
MNDESIQVLLVEDNPGDVRLVKEMLKEAGTSEIRMAETERLDQALQRMAREKFDVTLLDLGLPDSSGIDTLLSVQSHAPTMPVVVLTGLDDQALAMKALQHGAQDYLLKGQLQACPLMRSIRYAIERNQMQRALLEERDRAQKYLDVAGTIMVALGRDQTIRLINKRGCQVLKCNEAQALGKNWFDCFVPESVRSKVKSVYEKLMAGEIESAEYVENPVLTSDGEERIVAWHNALFRADSGEILGTLSSGEDITERERAQEALRESEQKSRILVSSITDGVIMLDKELHVALMNPVALSILGRQESDAYPEATEVQQALEMDFGEWSAKFGEDQETIERRVIGISGRVYETTIAPIRGARSGFRGMVVSLRDISEEKKLEELKSEFVSIVSHELRTPLTCIKNALDLILSKKTGDISKDQDKFLSMASRNVNRLARIINDFLDLSKMEAGKMEIRFQKLNPAAIIETAVSTFALGAKEKSVSLAAEIPPDLPIITGDPDRLNQVLSNLLSNALKYTPEGGKVTVKASSINRLETPIPGILSLPHRHYVRIEVADTGPGIPQDDLERIFDKFFQVEKSLTRMVPGTGLGLPICRQLVEAHKGKIWVESRPGAGSNFVFVLPLLDGVEIFNSYLENLIQRAKSAISCLSLDLVRINHFQTIKAGLGVKRGGEIFEEVVQIAKKSAYKATDHVLPDEESARVFLILENTPKEGALAVCDRLKQNLLDFDFALEDPSTELEFSLGVATYPDDANSAQELLRMAERTELIPALVVRQRTILVIDDEENFAHSLARKLRKHNYLVIEAFDGLEGLEKVTHLDPDLIILDIKMPRMDGYEVIKRLRQAEDTKNIPILALSGSLHTDTDRLMALGADEFVTKPFSDGLLFDAVRKLIRKREVKHGYRIVGG